MAEEPANLSEKFCWTSTTAKVGKLIDVATEESSLPSDKGDASTDGGNINPYDMTVWNVKSDELGTNPTGTGALGGESGVS